MALRGDFQLDDDDAARLLRCTPGIAQETGDRAQLGYGQIYYAIARFLQPRTALVIGSGYGFAPGAVALAMKHAGGSRRLLFVDPGLDNVTDGPNAAHGGAGTWQSPTAVHERFGCLGVESVVTHYRETDDVFFRKYRERGLPQIDFAIIDGAHDYEHARFDFEETVKRMRLPGFILLHDSTNFWNRTGHMGVAPLVQQIRTGTDAEVLTFPGAAGLSIVRVVRQGGLLPLSYAPRGGLVGAAVLALGAAALGGYWLGRRRARRRGLSGLGATSRRGPRTGVVEVSGIRQAVDRLLDQMTPCGPDLDARPPGEPRLLQLTYPGKMPTTDVPVRDAQTGAERDIGVVVLPRPPGSTTAGTYYPAHDEIGLRLPPDTCRSEGRWREELVGTLAHEVTHAADPWLRRVHGAKAARGGSYSQSGYDRCGYLNDPTERKAWLRNIYEEVASPEGIERIRGTPYIRTPDDVLDHLSLSWRSVRECWPEKWLRRARLVAADAFSLARENQRDYARGRRPGAGAAWGRQLDELEYPPQPCGLDYERFRGGWTYGQAYEHVAWGRGDAPRTITPGVVKREMGRLKRAEYERYQADCEAGKVDVVWDEGIDPRDFLDGLRRAATR